MTTGPVFLAVQATDPSVGAKAAADLRGRPGIVTLSATSAHRADVVLVLDELVSEQTLAWMRRVASQTARQESKFVVVGDAIRGSKLRQAAACGLVSVLPRRGCDYDRIVGAVMHLQQGRVELPGAEIRSLLAPARPQSDGTAPAAASRPGPGGDHMAGSRAAVWLDDREREALRLVAEGLDTVQIARALSYSERTVKNIIQKLLIRLELRNRPHAVAFALRNGLLLTVPDMPRKSCRPWHRRMTFAVASVIVSRAG
jgi:DNA-binding NarL/FixJ family response regulator